ncbi:ABC-type sugar transport system, permease component [Halobacteroides halobius DSM 5150]|uniref:ABC-type sugar transport system, permease component n=1 Tax=Halobacteroides halobius (strain ATCC 35273 / DSM 5150 / MD-1) TaxID=748449 RepID=L0K8Y3_HALHC|nr:carbohydrate ABC transporter permease [Halobacteroides halobius]AGB41747.1 ABC-type sugar transport system, permease component [Halobacteroides halobius DSM 5150]
MDIMTNKDTSLKTKLFVYGLLIFFALLYLGPFLWTLSSSFKHADAVFDWPFHLIPKDPTLQNYVKVFTTVPYGRWLFNSAFVTLTIVVSNLFLSSLAGYAFARIDFPGRDIIFMGLLGTMMIPGPVTIVPVFSLMSMLEWVNTYKALIFPGITGAFGIFLMRQFFQSIPMSLEDAARIDGLGRFGIWWRIVMPLAKPALGALTIFTFMGQWNNFMWPFLLTSTEDMFTLTVGMNAFKGQYRTLWNLVLTGSVLMAIPVIIVFIIFQNYFIKGVSFSGIKG